MKLSRLWFALCAGMLALGLCGCASPKPFTPKPILNWSRSEKRIVVVRPDIVLGLVTTGGLIEPQSDWSETARKAIVANISRHIGAKDVRPVPLDDLTAPHDGQLVKLYSALVAGENHPGWRADLRSRTVLQDTLGPGAQTLSARFDADYGMFFYLRDNYTSTGRVIANIATNVVLAAITIGRAQTNYSDASRIALVSLVDLHTGTIVWTKDRSTVTGDLRDAKDVAKFADSLFKEMPL